MNRRELVLGFAASAMLLPIAPLRAITLTEALKRRYEYRIFSGDSEIGQHTVTVSKDSSGLMRVEHFRELSMGFLFIRLYTFELRSREMWDGQTLKSLYSEGSENGSDFVVQGEAVRNGFAVSGPQGDFTAPPDVATTESVWRTSALRKPHLVDTVKGRVVQPLVHPLDDGRWHLEHGKLKADIRFDGEFMADADVDKDGHQVRFVRTTG